jgi:ribosomal protein L19
MFSIFSRQFSTTCRVNTVKKMTVYEPLPPLRQGKFLMDFIKESQYEKFDKSGTKRKALSLKNPERIRADDIVTVVYKNQKPVTGQVLMVKRSGLNSTILLRNKITGLGVEMNIPVYHPNIIRLDVVRRPATYKPRNRHYYIRNSRLDVGEITSSGTK